MWIIHSICRHPSIFRTVQHQMSPKSFQVPVRGSLPLPVEPIIYWSLRPVLGMPCDPESAFTYVTQGTLP